MVSKYAFHNGIWVKVLNFWFNFTEKINFPLFVRVFNRDHKANVANITQFFDRADGVAGILSIQKAYLPW